MNEIGKLHLILGPMYSQKSTRLINNLSRYNSIGLKVFCVNSVKDTRANDNEIKTHDQVTIKACKTEFLSQVHVPYNTQVIGIDEAQFFPDLIPFVKNKIEQSIIIIISGLDGDYQQNEFGDILKLIPIADSYEKVYAFCNICKNGTLAPFTKRINVYNEQILVGGKKDYISVCRKHLKYQPYDDIV